MHIPENVENGQISAAFDIRTSAQEAAEVESKDVLDLNDRARLVGYYFRKGDHEQRLRHVIWFANHAPYVVADAGYLAFFATQDAERYSSCRTAWLNAVERTRDERVIQNAVNVLCFGTLDDLDRADRLMESISAGRDEDWEFASKRGDIATAQARRACGREAAAQMLRRALAHYEASLSRCPEQAYELCIENVARVSARLGLWHRARACSETMIRLGQDAGRSIHKWNKGNLIHNGNILLGCSLRANDDIAGACACLREAGRSEGSPQLRTIGPDLTLAAVLWRDSQHSAVVEYLRDVRRFWSSGLTEVDRTIAQIEAGEEPDVLTRVLQEHRKYATFDKR